MPFLQNTLEQITPVFNLIPSSSRLDTTRNSNNITPFEVGHNFFKNYSLAVMSE